VSARLALLAGLALEVLQAPALAQDLQARVNAYKQRVELLEAQDAIENLQATYGYYFDKGLWDQAAALFTANGSFEYGMRGVYVGQAHIQRAMLLFGPQGLAPGHLNNHMQLQSVITVAADGLTAKARWQGMVMQAEPNANGIWGVGLYENEYVKEKGVWKIAKLHFYLTARTDYDEGFTKNTIRADGPSALFPPDKPPSVAYRSLPGNYIPPFSFPHPVTGKDLSNPVEPADSVLGPRK
jgi:hypothetical protein